MQGNRTLVIQRKPRIIFDKSFPIQKELDVGDKGQMEIRGMVDAERLDTIPDGTDILVKTIRIDSAELINNRRARI